jgi:hypothetical protein
MTQTVRVFWLLGPSDPESFFIIIYYTRLFSLLRSANVDMASVRVSVNKDAVSFRDSLTVSIAVYAFTSDKVQIVNGKYRSHPC